MRFAVSSGDGNNGVSHIHPDYITESDTLDNAMVDALAHYESELGEPDTIDGDETGLSAVWYEIGGAPALNGGSAVILDVFPWED